MEVRRLQGRGCREPRARGRGRGVAAALRPLGQVPRGDPPRGPGAEPRAETVWTEGFGGPVAPGNYGGAPAGPSEGVTGALPRSRRVPRGEPPARFPLPSGKPAAALGPEGGQRPNLASLPAGTARAQGGAGSPPGLPSSPPIPGKPGSPAPEPSARLPWRLRLPSQPLLSAPA